MNKQELLELVDDAKTDPEKIEAFKRRFREAKLRKAHLREQIDLLLQFLNE